MQHEEDRAYYDPNAERFGENKGCRIRMECTCGGQVELEADGSLVCRTTGKTVSENVGK